jgi:hypothetical protein
MPRLTHLPLRVSVNGYYFWYLADFLALKLKDPRILPNLRSVEFNCNIPITMDKTSDIDIDGDDIDDESVDFPKEHYGVFVPDLDNYLSLPNVRTIQAHQLRSPHVSNAYNWLYESLENGSSVELLHLHCSIVSSSFLQSMIGALDRLKRFRYSWRPKVERPSPWGGYRQG